MPATNKEKWYYTDFFRITLPIPAADNLCINRSPFGGWCAWALLCSDRDHVWMVHCTKPEQKE